MVGVLGLEPRTSALSGLRSSQLSYTPEGAGVYLPGAKRQARARPGGASRADPRLPDHLLSDAPISDPLSVVRPQRSLASWRPRPAARCTASAGQSARNAMGPVAWRTARKNDTSHATSLSRGSWKETPGADLLSRREAVSSAPRA